MKDIEKPKDIRQMGLIELGDYACKQGLWTLDIYTEDGVINKDLS